MKTFWKIPVFFSVCSFLGSWTSATVVKRRPRFPVNAISNGENELCPKVRIGQDDLPGFDLISQFQVDKAASRRAIQRVVGSTALQVAYKLGNNVDFRIPTRHLYPSGLPEEYSFLTTFRMTGSTLEKNWSIWQIQDSSGKEEVGVKINGQTKSVAFSYKGLDGSLQSAVFSDLPSLFDSQWHKIMIGVERSTATLFVDCNRIESLPIEPRGQISVDGFAVLGKLAENPQVSVPVSIKSHCGRVNQYQTAKMNTSEVFRNHLNIFNNEYHLFYSLSHLFKKPSVPILSVGHIRQNGESEEVMQRWLPVLGA